MNMSDECRTPVPVKIACRIITGSAIKMARIRTPKEVIGAKLNGGLQLILIASGDLATDCG
jgi:hypothetical protein